MSINRIAILSVHTSPLAPMGGKKTGGMNVYIRELAYELGQRGYQVDIFTRRNHPSEPQIDHGIGANVRVIYVEAGPVMALAPDEIYPYLSQFVARVMAFAARQNIGYDIVYSHYWLSGWVAQKLKEAWGVPFVQMFHTLGRMKQRILSHENIFPDQRIQTETMVMDWADGIIAATPAEYSQLLWLYRAKRRKIDIVPPGVNPQRFHPVSEADAKARVNFDPDKRYLLFVGRIEPLKAVDTVIQALGEIKQSDPDRLQPIRFAVIGGNPSDQHDAEMMRLQALTRDLGLEDVVLFLGAKDQTALPDYYAAAAAVIMPSDYESFGMVALEAMAMGTPVIASNVGGLSYLVKDNETGYHVPVREPQALATAILNIVHDDDRRYQLGQNAAQLAHQYAWATIADRLLTIFADIRRKRSRQTVYPI